MPTFPIHHAVPSYSTLADAPRYFGARRSGGRLHAACDLWAPVGTPIHAIASGRVLRFAFFYSATWAIEVLHPGIGVVRYGEVMPPSSYATSQAALRAAFAAEGIALGAPITAPSFARGDVKEGEIIGAVGQLIDKRGRRFPHTMLHLELYDEAAAGQALSPKGFNRFERNPHLRDATPLLMRLQGKRPVHGPGKAPSIADDLALANAIDAGRTDPAAVRGAPLAPRPPNPVARPTKPRDGDWKTTKHASPFSRH